ncbi:MAG: FG-GAP-like repeat-containing protein [Gammaproteobacteria bacterium]|nr:FG-GAP-like repeat-containing protein [Gammaproteobacteria bacterium]
MRHNTHLLRISASLVLMLSSAGLYAVKAGLPFTEDFVDTDLRDSALTNANWSTEEQALFLAWRSSASEGTGNESAIDGLTDDTRSVALGDLDDDGDLDVIAGNNGVSSVIYLNDGTGDFVLHQTLLDINATRSVVLGDVNGDGALDIVMGNHGEVNRLYLNNGSGVFPLNGTAIGSEIDDTTSVSLGDVDGDGDLDLVTGSDNATQTNKRYLNNSDGVFASSGTPLGAIDNVTTTTILLDVDGDGDQDLAIANYSTGVANKLYENNGSGNFSTNIRIIGVGKRLTNSLVAGDVDGDGTIDFISGNEGDANYLHLNSASTFNDSEIVIGVDDAADVTTSVSLADSDNDGYIDLIVGNLNGHTKRYINNGGGGFPDSGEVISGSVFMTYSTALGDVDGDGDLDIITGGSAETTKLYLNSAGGGGYAVTGHSVGSEIDNTWAVVLGDVNDDGFLDLIAGNAGQTNKLYLNDGTGGFSEVGVDIGTTTDITYSLVLHDMDNDGDLDLIAGNWGTTNKIYLNDFSDVTTDDFLPAADIGLDTEMDTTTSIAVALVNNDVYFDVIVGNWGTTNKVYLNDADVNPAVAGVFSTTGTDIGSETDNTSSIALGDVDGVNLFDLVVGNRDQENKLYLHNGAEGFSSATNIGADTDDTLSLVLGAVDAGSDLDLIVGNAEQVNKLYLNVRTFAVDGDGVAVGSETDVTMSLLLTDVDGDGDLDLLAGNDGSPNVRYLNDGTGVFSTVGSPLNPGSITATRALVVGDLDGLTDDNNTDVDLVAAEYGVTNKVYKNRLYQTHLGRVVSGKINTTETNFRGFFLSATTTINAVTLGNTWINYYLSNNGGAKWYQVSSDKLFAIPEAGSDLRWKAELHSLSPIRSPVLSEMKVEINIPPVITGGATRNVSVAGGETAVTTVVATDEDGAVLVYGIVGGDDEGKFALDSASGVLTFIEAPDFTVPTDSNGDNIYYVRVRVEDSGGGRPTDSQDIFVTVTDPAVPWVDGGGANSIGWLSSLLLLLLLRKRRRASI